MWLDFLKKGLLIFLLKTRSSFWDTGHIFRKPGQNLWKLGHIFRKPNPIFGKPGHLIEFWIPSFIKAYHGKSSRIFRKKSQFFGKLGHILGKWRHFPVKGSHFLILWTFLGSTFCHHIESYNMSRFDIHQKQRKFEHFNLTVPLKVIPTYLQRYRMFQILFCPWFIQEMAYGSRIVLVRT